MSEFRDLKVTFANVFEPPFGLFRTSFPKLEARGIHAEAVLSAASYRDEERPYKVKLVKVPTITAKGKRWTQITYTILAPFKLFGRIRLPDAFVFLSSPPLFYVFVAALSRLLRIPYVIHVMDVYPELFQRVGWVSCSNWLYRWLRRKSTGAMNGAVGVVVIGRCMKQFLIERGVQQQKIHTVPNWAPGHIGEIGSQENRFLAAHEALAGSFITMYSGNMGRAHDFRSLLDAAQALKANSRFRFVIIGTGYARADVEAEVGRRRLDNVHLMGYASDEDLAHLLSAASVHYVSLRPGYEGLVVPSKFYSAWAVGRPVVFEGPEESELALEIRERGGGVVISPGDARAVAMQLQEWESDPQQYQRVRKEAQQAHTNYHHPDVASDGYARTLARLLRDDP